MNKHISYSIINNQTMIVNNQTNYSILLDESGTEIWNLILQNKNKEQVIEVLINKYPEYREQIINDVSSFYEILYKNYILEKE